MKTGEFLRTNKKKLSAENRKKNAPRSNRKSGMGPRANYSIQEAQSWGGKLREGKKKRKGSESEKGTPEKIRKKKSNSKGGPGSGKGTRTERILP